MSKLGNVGHLMYVYMDYIKPVKTQQVSEFLITAMSKLLKEYGGRNWLPLIVKEIGEDQYEVIANHFIYDVAKAASLERVWCIIADDTPETAQITRILSQEEFPKINLSSASKEEIQQALEFIIQQPDSSIKGIKINVVANRIAQAPRQYWQNFEPITKLKCGITIGKKLDYLKQFFYLSPIEIPPNIKDEKLLNSLKINDLKALAKKREIKGYSKLNKTALIKLLTEQ